MNADAPKNPREELEVRVTAMLMGELSDEEAAALREKIAADPALAALHDRLRHVVGLLREASTDAAEPASAEPLRLSAGRRERLLAQFKTVPAGSRFDWRTFAQLGIAAALVAVIGGSLMMPTFSHVRTRNGVTMVLEDSQPTAEEVASSTVNLVIGQIRPTAPAPEAAAERAHWAAQPGAIRTYSGSTAAGQRGEDVAGAKPEAEVARRYSYVEIPKAVTAGAKVEQAQDRATVAEGAKVFVTGIVPGEAPADAAPTERYFRGRGIVSPPAAAPAPAPALAFSDAPAAAPLSEPLPTAGKPTLPVPAERPQAGGASGIAGGAGAAPANFGGLAVAGQQSASNPEQLKQLGETTANFAGREISQSEKLGELPMLGTVFKREPAESAPAAPASPLSTGVTALGITDGGLEASARFSTAGVSRGGEKPESRDSLAAQTETLQNDLTKAQAEFAEKTQMIDALAAQVRQKDEALAAATAEVNRYRTNVARSGVAAAEDKSTLRAIEPQAAAPTDGFADTDALAAVKLDGASRTSKSGAVADLKARSKDWSGQTALEGRIAAAGDWLAEENRPADKEESVESLAKERKPIQETELAFGLATATNGQMRNQLDGTARVEEPALKQRLEKIEDGIAPAQKEATVAGKTASYKKSINPERRAGIEQTKQFFADADGFISTGRYDLALKRTEQILNVDPYNIEARKMQEKINNAVDDYGVASYNETRSRISRDLNTTWAMPARKLNQQFWRDDESVKLDINTASEGIIWDTSTQKPAQSAEAAAAVEGVAETSAMDLSRNEMIQKKLERIIIPRLEFKEATISEAVDFLKKKSVELDTTEPVPANRGVNFVVQPNVAGAANAASAATAPGDPNNARITVSLTNIPLSEAVRYVSSLAGLKYKVDSYAVALAPATVNTDTVTTKEYKVPPELMKTMLGDTTRGGAEIATRDSAKESLIAGGVQFGPNASAIYLPESNQLVVRNTQEQIDLVETILATAESKLLAAQEEATAKKAEEDAAIKKLASTPPAPQPEIATSANAFSTFSLNVSDVSFKLAAASLEQGQMPEPGAVRSEEFINAFDYCDREPVPGAPLACTTERARYPFAQNRDLLRFSIKTAAAGRQPGRALNLVLLLDNSGSMERADRVRIVREALRVLAGQLQPQDKLSVVTFSRTPRLWADGVAGDKAGEVAARCSEITPQGGTNIATALDLGYQTALRHFQAGSINRVVLLTDGAANLGDVNPEALKQKVEVHRKQGIALDCFGIGWEGYNDDLLEQLSRNGDGRYGFINTPEQAATEFAGQLAGALRVAASDVKTQVEFNPRRVTAWRQIGYAKHQLTKEQFRDNTVDAAEIGAAESGNALYVCEVNPRGEGDLATVRVRFKVPGTSDYREHEWSVPFNGPAGPLEQSSPALRLAGSASAFSEMLAGNPFATEVTSDRLLALLNGVPETFGADPRPKRLEWMIRQAKSLSGR